MVMKGGDRRGGYEACRGRLGQKHVGRPCRRIRQASVSKEAGKKMIGWLWKDGGGEASCGR
jgi:hypothetical protein